MKVRDLPPEANLLGVKIKLTPEMKEAYENYCSKGEDEIYLIGHLMGDFFISPDPPEKVNRALYPLPLELNPKDFLECEIIK